MLVPLQALRQSTASLLGFALLDIFPGVLLIDTEVSQVGFYCTFRLKQRLEQNILTLIEEKMRELVRQDLPIYATSMMRENAAALFKHKGQVGKAERVLESSSNIVPILKMGEALFDYAPAPYLESIGEIAAFKLLSLELIDEEESVFEIAGTVFPDQKSLKTFLKRSESAKKCDHQLLGNERLLFSSFQRNGWFWFPKGEFLREFLSGRVREGLSQRGFLPVSTPRLVDKGDKKVVIDPVSSVVKQQARLFSVVEKEGKGVPFRVFEKATLTSKTKERSCGLFNVLSWSEFVASTVCLPDQVLGELISSLQFIEKTVNMLGFEYQWMLVSKREKSADSTGKWGLAVKWLKEALEVTKFSYIEKTADFNLERPRIVLLLEDAVSRVWNGAFVEVNLHYIEALNLLSASAEDLKKLSCMVVCSPLGSVERCVAMLVERYANGFPLSLAPEQVRVLPVANKNIEYANSVCLALEKAKVRCSVDSRQEPLGTKVHTVEKERIPYAVIIGDSEEGESAVSVRTCSQHGKTTKMSLTSFLHMLQKESAKSCGS